MVPVLVMIIVLIVIHCVTDLVTKSHNVTSTALLSESIFVGIVAYKDANWVEMAVNILSNAKHPCRVFVGVLEYVREFNERSVELVPNKFRNNVRSLQISIPQSETLGKARKKLFDKLFCDEKFTLFTKSCQLCADWDEMLCFQISKTGPTSMLVSHLTTKPAYAYITDLRDKTIYYNLREFECFGDNESIPSLLWVPEFNFAYSSVCKFVIVDETVLGVSSVLHKNKVPVYYTEVAIGVRFEHPRGIREGKCCLVDDDIVSNFIKYLSDDEMNLSKYSLHGLTRNATVTECVCKYGSARKARFLLRA